MHTAHDNSGLRLRAHVAAYQYLPLFRYFSWKFCTSLLSAILLGIFRCPCFGLSIAIFMADRRCGAQGCRMWTPILLLGVPPRPCLDASVTGSPWCTRFLIVFSHNCSVNQTLIGSRRRRQCASSSRVSNCDCLPGWLASERDYTHWKLGESNTPRCLAQLPLHLPHEDRASSTISFSFLFIRLEVLWDIGNLRFCEKLYSSSTYCFCLLLSFHKNFFSSLPLFQVPT